MCTSARGTYDTVDILAGWDFEDEVDECDRVVKEEDPCLLIGYVLPAVLATLALFQNDDERTLSLKHKETEVDITLESTCRYFTRAGRDLQDRGPAVSMDSCIDGASGSELGIEHVLKRMIS